MRILRHSDNLRSQRYPGQQAYKSRTSGASTVKGGYDYQAIDPEIFQEKQAVVSW